jgi:hypothetical protein
MTSIARDEYGVYRAANFTAQNPKYNILSYTWGRWKIDDCTQCPVLPVKGTDWEIPAVKQDHFTVEAFQNVLLSMLAQTNIELAWVDIGCIDQDNNPESAIEIGQQALIFKQATNAFVWLSRLHNADLSMAIERVGDHTFQIGNYLHHYNPDLELDLDSSVDNLKKALDYILNDPWFSSLWTLQEAILRRDAIVLSAEGQPIFWREGLFGIPPTPRVKYMDIDLLTHSCRLILQLLEGERKFVSPMPKNFTEVVSHIQQKILQTGFFQFSDNPNVYYGAARYRSTTRDVDRIYAITQIYDIRVGKSIQPEENLTLEDLIDEFARTINRRSVVLGQLFLHTKVPAKGKSWRITEELTVPYHLTSYGTPMELSTIELSPHGQTIATGRSCHFADLHAMAMKVEEEARDERYYEPNFRVHLDHHIKGFSSYARSHYITVFNRSREREPLYVRSDYYQSVWVLQLGSTVFDIGMSRSFGLLLHQVVADSNGGSQSQNITYERLGVCSWDTRVEPISQRGFPVPWHDISQFELQ